MKRNISIVYIVLVATTLPGVSYAVETYSPDHEKVRQQFKSSAEPTSKDAIWTAVDVFKVGVINDGNDRSGYASYVCEVLYENGFKGKKVWVQVVDIAKLANQGEWIKIGESHCL